MLNHHAFQLLAGNPAPWDAEVRARAAGGESLAEIQRDQHERGRLSAELVRTADGWAVRGASSLQVESSETFITPQGQSFSHEDALRMGQAWADADPDNRELFCVRTVAAQTP